ISQLDFTSPTNNGGAKALDGNKAANQKAINFTIKKLGNDDLEIDPDLTFDIQWTLTQPAMGLSHGLAEDDLKVTVTGTKAAIPEPSALALLAVGMLTLLGWRWRTIRRTSTG